MRRRREGGGDAHWPLSPSPLRYVPVLPRDGSIPEQSRRHPAGKERGGAVPKGRRPPGLHRERRYLPHCSGGAWPRADGAEEEGKGKSSGNAAPRSRTRLLTAQPNPRQRAGETGYPRGCFGYRKFKLNVPGTSREPFSCAVPLPQPPSEACAACGKGRGTDSAFRKLPCSRTELVNLFGR